jgi:homospermidine synthase
VGFKSIDYFFRTKYFQILGNIVTDVVLERKELNADAPISVSNLASKFVDQDQLDQALIEAAEAYEAAEEAQQRVAELELEVAAKAGKCEMRSVEISSLEKILNGIRRWFGWSIEIQE